ncbi:MAG: DNA/RNA nuclease SfsA [Gaiellales bacterium]|nr:MAG: DNA/RNA nuclease SfsA [Gaiellales bacterium]
MKLPTPLIEGRLLRRYQRFLADVELADGSVVTAHTPNTGSMRDLCEAGLRVWLYDTGSPRRKYPLSWELVETRGGVLVGINTLRANGLVREAIEDGTVAELQGYDSIRQEVTCGSEGSRIDLLLTGPPGSCYVEVKNVTLVEGGVALFPDAVTTRGARHLRELSRLAAAGHRAVILFCVQRADAREVRPADHIDPAYGLALREAVAAGVEALACRAAVSLDRVRLSGPLPVAIRDGVGA